MNDGSTHLHFWDITGLIHYALWLTAAGRHDLVHQTSTVFLAVRPLRSSRLFMDTPFKAAGCQRRGWLRTPQGIWSQQAQPPHTLF